MDTTGRRSWLLFVGLALLGGYLSGVRLGRSYYALQLAFVALSAMAALIAPVRAWRWGLATAFVGQVLFVVVRAFTGWPTPSDMHIFYLPWGLPGCLITATPSVLAAILVENLRNRWRKGVDRPGTEQERQPR